MTPALAESAAIRYCETVTRSEARNFWYGIRLLPPTKRRLLAAVYAMARRIDDVADGDLAPNDKRVALTAIGASLDAVETGSDDPVLAALHEGLGVCRLPLTAFGDLVDGVCMDVDGVSYDSFDDLVPYCRRVAGSIGRLSLAVFRTGEGPVTAKLDALADDLGVALQLTNILRDVREDFGNGRVYLPLDDLARFGVEPYELGGGPGPQTSALVRHEAARAREWFDRGLRLTASLDWRSAACVGAMAGIYSRLLARIERQPELVFRGRLSLPPYEKAWVAVRALTGATR
jgi:15-cis-phytoene synthase